MWFLRASRACRTADCPRPLINGVLEVCQGVSPEKYIHNSNGIKNQFFGGQEFTRRLLYVHDNECLVTGFPRFLAESIRCSSARVVAGRRRIVSRVSNRETRSACVCFAPMGVNSMRPTAPRWENVNQIFVEGA